MNEETIRKNTEKIYKQMEMLRLLGITQEKDIEKVNSIWKVADSQERDRDQLRNALGEMMGVLERRSELTEEIRSKHKEFSHLKSLKKQFDEFGEKLKIKRTDPDVQNKNQIKTNEESKEEVYDLESKEKKAMEEEKKLRKKVLSVRRQLVKLTKSNDILYEEMESVERLSFKLFYFLLSEGETQKVKPVIEQSLMENTLKRAAEIDCVFGSKDKYIKAVKKGSKKAYEMACIQGFGVLEEFWEKGKLKENKKFSLFEEFKV